MQPAQPLLASGHVHQPQSHSAVGVHGPEDSELFSTDQAG
jgi:hypothetical protein